jgi:gamma-glutamylcyclotransferase
MLEIENDRYLNRHRLSGGGGYVGGLGDVGPLGAVIAMIHPVPMRRAMITLWRKRRRLIARSWVLSRLYYPLRGARLVGRPGDEIWYFAYGANMHEATFRVRRGIRPFDCRPGRIKGYRLRFNLEGWPKGKAAPANMCVEPDAEVWGVLYRITLRDLVRLDSTEGVPGRGYRHAAVEAEDTAGRPLQAIAYIAQGKEVDGKPSLRYIRLLREGARAHGLPAHYIRFLEDVDHAR